MRHSRYVERNASISLEAMAVKSKTKNPGTGSDAVLKRKPWLTEFRGLE
jgi:hypothetical protein